MTHTDQFEEIVKAFDKQFKNCYTFRISEKEREKIHRFLSSVSDHIREEAEKETYAAVSEKIDKYFQGLLVIQHPSITRDSLKTFILVVPSNPELK